MNLALAARGVSITAARLYTLQNLYMTRARVLTRAVDRHGTPARPTNFHSHTSSSWPNGAFAPSLGCCAVTRSAPALPLDAVRCQRARGSSTRTSWSLEPTLQTSAALLQLGGGIACERLERGGGQCPVERGTPRSRSELGKGVSKTPSAAQRQRGIEPPAAAARAALNRRFAVGELRQPLFTSLPPLISSVTQWPAAACELPAELALS